tara:strand:- start:283 stop:465 length:183 start_codon:yes stop_codon:yes gene_type:complete
MAIKRVTQSAGNREYFKAWIKKNYGKGYSVKDIITKRDARSYSVGTYTAVLKEKKFMRKK